MVERFARLDAETEGKAAIAAFLGAMADLFCDPALPGGCFLINGTADLGGAGLPEAIATALRERIGISQCCLRERLQRAVADGQLARPEMADDLAAHFFATLVGMAVMAKAGYDRDALERVIRGALAAWP